MPPTAIETEIDRIQAEYARRERELPPNLYSWTHPANLSIHHGIVRACIRALRARQSFPLDGQAVADIGCGSGSWMLEFAQWGADPAHMAGIDLQPARVDLARRRLPSASLHSGSAAHLPWPDEQFDLVTQFMLLSSVLSTGLRQAIAAEMLRVLKPGGHVLWYDLRYDNPWNSQVRGIRAAELRSLFAPCEVEFRAVTLAPPLARIALRCGRPVSALLECVPVLRSHYVAVIQKSDRPVPRGRRESGCNVCPSSRVASTCATSIKNSLGSS